jgi:hypothetical protein
MSAGVAGTAEGVLGHHLRQRAGLAVALDHLPLSTCVGTAPGNMQLPRIVATGGPCGRAGRHEGGSFRAAVCSADGVCPDRHPRSDDEDCTSASPYHPQDRVLCAPGMYRLNSPQSGVARFGEVGSSKRRQKREAFLPLPCAGADRLASLACRHSTFSRLSMEPAPVVRSGWLCPMPAPLSALQIKTASVRTIFADWNKSAGGKNS